MITSEEQFNNKMNINSTSEITTSNLNKFFKVAEKTDSDTLNSILSNMQNFSEVFGTAVKSCLDTINSDTKKYEEMNSKELELLLEELKNDIPVENRMEIYRMIHESNKNMHNLAMGKTLFLITAVASFAGVVCSMFVGRNDQLPPSEV